MKIAAAGDGDEFLDTLDVFHAAQRQQLYLQGNTLTLPSCMPSSGLLSGSRVSAGNCFKAPSLSGHLSPTRSRYI